MHEGGPPRGFWGTREHGCLFLGNKGYFGDIFERTRYFSINDMNFGEKLWGTMAKGRKCDIFKGFPETFIPPGGPS